MFRRWITLVAYAVIGAFVAHLARPLLLPLGDAFASRVVPLGTRLLELSLGAVVAGIIMSLSTMYTARWRHVFRLNYPSWIWAAVAGGILAEVLASIAGESNLTSQSLLRP